VRRGWFFAGAAARILSALSVFSLELPWTPDDVYRVPTLDGASIALGRYHPRGPRRFLTPVVLCHGLGANRFDLDFDETYSVARFLARRGFETWVLELRGRGMAGRPMHTTFDDQARDDVGTALKTVLSANQARDVLWVGHSKGGLVAYAHLARQPNAPIRAVVTMGTPIQFDAQPGVKQFLRAVAPALKLKTIPMRWATGLIAPLGLPPWPLGPYLANAGNMEPRVIRQAISNVSADILGGVARQFSRWISTGRLDGEDGFDYRAALKNVKTPMLLVAGIKDMLAPPSTVTPTLKLLGGPAEYLLLAMSQGFSADYGHGDLVLGRRAPEEVFPKVAEFLERHAEKMP
jgi:pimeloyl-ACP methyl ester carboxylesterase